MSKERNAARERQVNGALMRLMLVTRVLVYRARYFQAGNEGAFCFWCTKATPPGEAWLPGRHETACPIGGVTAIMAELAELLSVNGFREMDARGQEGRPAGLPPFSADLGSGRKPPARVVGLEASNAAVSVLPRPPVDCGEPWRVRYPPSNLGHDRYGQEIYATGAGMHPGMHLAGDEYVYARRIAAAVNLCAGAPTEALEQAFQEIASTSPRWALLALNIQNLNAGHVASIRDFVDDVVKAAAAPAPIDYGGPQ